MPLELVATAPYKLEFHEYEDPPLREKQVRLQSEFGSTKHGTERGFYRGTAALAHGRMNEQNIYVTKEEVSQSIYPYLLGNMTVGRVTEIGSRVTKWKVGQRVFLYGGFRQTHTISEDELWTAPEPMTAESFVYWDPAKYAYGGVLAGGVMLGHRVAVFGLGAIGQMIVQMAKLCGALEIFAIDTFEIRREAASRYGATQTLDPTNGDVGRSIKEATDGQGVDVALEASGVVVALHQAIRSTRRGGKIVTVGLYEGPATDLRLDQDWHRNQQVMIASQGPNVPIYGQPTWEGSRVVDTAFELLKRKWLVTEGLVTPIVRFEELAEAYRAVDENPASSIKLGARY